MPHKWVKTMPNKASGAFMLVVVGVVLGVSGCQKTSSPPATPSTAFTTMQVGDTAPPFSRLDTAGDSVHVGPNQQPTLLNLWATWCAPCLEEFPDLESIHQDLSPVGLRVLGLNVEEVDAAALSDFAAELGASFTIVLDPPATLQDTYRAIAMPTTFFIDRNGIVRRVWTGRLPEDAHTEIATLLKDITS